MTMKKYLSIIAALVLMLLVAIPVSAQGEFEPTERGVIPTIADLQERSCPAGSTLFKDEFPNFTGGGSGGFIEKSFNVDGLIVKVILTYDADNTFSFEIVDGTISRLYVKGSILLQYDYNPPVSWDAGLHGTVGGGGYQDVSHLDLCLSSTPPTPTPTNTATATATDTPTNTPTNTATATATDTPTNTPTNTATATPTDTPTNTPTPTPTDTATATPTNTATPTPTDTPTNTPTNTPTSTPTNTPTSTPTPDPGDGCTPGYWRQSQHFDSWVGFTTNQTLESVFNVPDSFGLDNHSLVQALQFNGGSGNKGAAQTLLRAAVAALLNSANSNVDYPLTTDQVIEAVNAALTGNRNAMLTLAAQLDSYNNLGCPLN
jgi:hypothetical protein